MSSSEQAGGTVGYVEYGVMATAGPHKGALLTRELCEANDIPFEPLYRKITESDPKCPECGQIGGCPANDVTPRWEHDRVRKRLGFPTEGRCPNCGCVL